uniref:Uncharacterized protein n=1 Tax=Cacopsylla melanoneura TaxID=428564 RepID=A0A8D8YTI8_9HEMI
MRIFCQKFDRPSFSHFWTNLSLRTPQKNWFQPLANGLMGGRDYNDPTARRAEEPYPMPGQQQHSTSCRRKHALVGTATSWIITGGCEGHDVGCDTAICVARRNYHIILSPAIYLYDVFV